MSFLKYNESISQLFKGLINFVGLDDFIVDVSLDSGFEPKVYVTLRTIVDATELRNAPSSFEAVVEKALKPIIDKVQNSDAVKQALRELTEKLNETEKKLLEAEAEIARLKPIESHYDLEYKLRHGK